MPQIGEKVNERSSPKNLSFRALHEQLDDDNDGTIEPSETGDFIREDLHYRGSNDKQQQQMRQKRFHGQVKALSINDVMDFLTLFPTLLYVLGLGINITTLLTYPKNFL